MFHVKRRGVAMQVSRETPKAIWDPETKLTPHQWAQLETYARLLQTLGRRHNLVSRETLQDVYRRHILHCLALAWRAFPSGSVVVDWGTGGGLPAIPLAIAFPDITVHAIEAVQKKVLAVRTMIRQLGLSNLQVHHARAETWMGSAHYSVSRATAPLSVLWRWHRRIAQPQIPLPESWKPGLLTFKGGDLAAELAALERLDACVSVTLIPLAALLGDAYFTDKYLVQVIPEPEGMASVR
jgi:16S rRNA (guanine527-N7)-methyltransferase